MSLTGKLGIGAGLLVLVLAGAFAVVTVVIRSGVRDVSEAAVAEYGGDRVDALMALADSTDHSMRERNRAVWALGQIGDQRALPVLERHFTGQPCDHERFLCQYELKKAIRQARR
jgi:hypothetical protein